MTCVVAVEHGGRIWMGSDSFMGSDDVRDALDQPKIFRSGSHLLIGYAGAFRAAQLMQYATTFRARKTGETELGYLVTVVAKQLQETHKNANLTNSSKADFLVAYAGKVYTLQDDYSVVRSAYGYAAVGAGSSYALGALAVLEPSLPPKKRVEQALRAATRHCPQVIEPFAILSL